MEWKDRDNFMVWPSITEDLCLKEDYNWAFMSDQFVGGKGVKVGGLQKSYRVKG
jgi:hypothetical protein